MKICLIFFSATNNTRTISLEIKKELERIQNHTNVNLTDITPFSNREKTLNLDKYEKFIFGFPVYGWNIPKVIRQWLKTIDGNGRECAMFFTYGGINPGVVHFETTKLLSEQNFKVIASAEFVASHSYNLGGWKVLENRPDKEDFRTASIFTQKLLKRFQKKKSKQISFNSHKYSDKILKRIENNPKRFVNPPKIVNKCSFCSLCEEICPTNAIDIKKGFVDEKKCIRCLSCVLNCPEDVLKINDLNVLFDTVLQIEHLSREKIKNRKSKIFL